jgi:hypothetical protein
MSTLPRRRLARRGTEAVILPFLHERLAAVGAGALRESGQRELQGRSGQLRFRFSHGRRYYPKDTYCVNSEMDVIFTAPEGERHEGPIANGAGSTTENRTSTASMTIAGAILLVLAVILLLYSISTNGKGPGPACTGVIAMAVAIIAAVVGIALLVGPHLRWAP